tara:strand:- start:387 stop:608 length:222 start_codon:yes stop_codon:yes gene_type:complete
MLNRRRRLSGHKTAKTPFIQKVLSFWRPNHVVERGVKKIQSAIEMLLFQVTFPNDQSQFLGGGPSVVVETFRP